MRIRVLVMLAYASICSIGSLAQPILLQGTVFDTLQHPLPGATILLSDRGQNTVYCFARSNALGQYQVRVPPGLTHSLVLTARLLGYRPVTVPVDTGYSVKKYHFRLGPATEYLQEVIVRAPVTQRNDTTTYDLTQFVDSLSIEKLESVLQRLPGFEVMDNGTLYFKGRRVEKLLLDGDNLFDNRYTTATRNLRATLIDKVQAIEGYQENQVLKGLKKSDVVAVNLTVAPRKRHIFAGSADATTNFGSRYGASLNGLSYVKSLKTTLIGDVNNTQAAGSVLEAEPASAQTPFDLEPAIAGSNSLSPVLPETLPAKRTFDRHTAASAINVAVPWSKTVKSRGYIVALGQREKSSRQMTEVYGRGAFFEVQEDMDNRQRGQTVAAQHELTWNSTPRTQVQLRSWLNLVCRLSQQTLTGNLLNGPINERLLHRPMGYALQGQFTHRLNGQNAVQTTVTYGEFGQQQAYHLPQRTLDTALLPQKTVLTEQANEFRRRQVTAATDWFWQAKNGYSGSLQWQRTQTAQEQQVRRAAEIDLPADSLRIRLKENHHVARSSIRRTFSKTEVVIGGYLHVLSAATSAGLHQTKGFIGPLLTIRHQFSPTKILLLSYKYDLADEVLSAFFPGQLVKGYRAVYRGLNALSYWGHQVGLVNYSGQDILANRRVSITLLGSRRDNSVLNAFRITPRQLVTEATLAGRASGMVNLNGSAEQLIPHFDLLVKGKLSINAADQYVQLNSITQRIRTWSTGYGLELNTVFDSPLLINLAGQYSTNTTQVSGPVPLLRSTAVLLQEKVAVKFSNGLRGRIQGVQLYTRSDKGALAGQFLDAQIDYTPSKSRWAFSLEGRNLLKAGQFPVQSVTELSRLTQSYALLGRWLLWSLSRSF